MSKQADFLMQLDALLELEARERLQQNDEYYVNDVVLAGKLAPAYGAAMRQWVEEEEIRTTVAAERRMALEAIDAQELLEFEKRQVFNRSYKNARLYLPRMIKLAPTDLSLWARKLIKHYRSTDQFVLIQVYLYLNLRSVLEWEAAHQEPLPSYEDRESDLQRAAEDTYDGGPSQFDSYYTSLSLAVVSLRGDRIVNQDRPDLVVAA